MDFESIRQLKSKIKYDDASKRLDELTAKIVNVNKNLETSKINLSNDWTNIYKFCDDYEDLEDLSTNLKKEEEKLDSMKQYENDVMGHAHDHSEERKIFEKPEEEKVKLVEQHHNGGNLLYSEGNWVSAIQDYQLAISYYEYCFPKDSAIQIKIDKIKIDSLCQLSSCYSNIGYHKLAVDTLNNCLNIDKMCAIGYFRRGMAYRYLDEFEKSRIDLIEANRLFELCTEAEWYKRNISKQLQLLDQQEKNVLIAEKQLAHNMLNNHGKNNGNNVYASNKNTSSQFFSNISTLHTNKNETLQIIMDFEYPLDF